MRRERRIQTRDGLKYQIYISVAVLIILIIIFVTIYIVYKNKLRELSKSFTSPELITSLVPNNSENIPNMLQEASTEISKTIDEALDNTTNVEIVNETQVDDSIIVEEINETITEEPVIQKVLEFIYPVEGEIIKNYAMDNLIFSETLQEWTTHPGIDIKCARTTVVKAAEEGTIFAIKNDPRYGTTVIVDHGDGYKTVYSNLLTTEFVTLGEKITKNQSIGTVGNSAIFEISDEPHLHFELLKDEDYLDPTLYLK